jgi:hypothetical protein
MENKMTVEQVKEKFGNTVLRFSSYYKYMFAFTGHTDDGHKIMCMYGGNSDDIYRYDVDANSEYRLGNLNDWSAVVIKDGANNEVFYQNNDW